MIIQTQSRDVEGMARWLGEYVGPAIDWNPFNGYTGPGWRLIAARSMSTSVPWHVIYLADIRDEKLATLFALRWA
jgi:hypothetical protein